jgi:hypothetical protein
MSAVLGNGATVLRGAYLGLVTDTAGTVAQNAYMIVFNPVGSGITASTVELIVSSYTVGSSTTPSSLLISRITGFTGGTVVTPSNVGRFVTTMPDPKCQLITGNPTFTAVGLPVNANPPPISTGAGTGGTGVISAPSPALLLPGQGVVAYTAAGNINQMWDIEIAWTEF